MTLDEILALLRLRERPQMDCADVNDLRDQHIGRVVQRIRKSRSLATKLKALRARCASPRATADYGILDGLDGAIARDGTAPRRRVGVHAAEF